ncbi:hypothetical protein SNE40_003375 [Patella caerulea]|uniref:3-hydroxyisobutyryl-CoA hydrolase, mitochondrial n=2 Tax=Patella caerulea TaxID=87958 RepID=A0AAN8KDT8_PATCE
MCSAGMAIGSHNEVIHQVVNKTAMIILNRPQALNSLNYSMIQKIHPQIRAWEADSDVQLLIMKGSGDKAFCAGGDIVALTQTHKKDGKYGFTFFPDEYKLDYALGTYSKPYIAIIDGVTMGGGVGLSVHGQFRVATERTLFAMPETGIGLIPDVGGGYFLPRLQGKLGMYLALTGYRLKGRDVQLAGVATHYIQSNKITELEETLVGLDQPSIKNVNEILDSFHKESTSEQHDFILKSEMDKINRVFSGASLEQIFENLEKDGSEWALKELNKLKRMSPTSMKLTFRQITEGGQLSLEDVFLMENRLTQRCMEDHDFYEGVRALLVEKDQKPQWKPDTLEGVTQEKVDWYFSKLPNGREMTLP